MTSSLEESWAAAPASGEVSVGTDSGSSPSTLATLPIEHLAEKAIMLPLCLCSDDWLRALLFVPSQLFQLLIPFLSSHGSNKKILPWATPGSARVTRLCTQESFLVVLG